MVRTNGRRKRLSRRQSQPMRSSMRKLHQAVSKLAVPSRLIADPPPVKINRVCHLTLQALLVAGSGSTIYYSPYGDTRIYSIKNDNELFQWGISRNEVYSIVQSTMDLSDKVQTSYAISISKVACWGPVPQSYPCALTLHIDWFESDNSQTDIGSANSRPRVAFNLPMLHWTEGSDTGNFIGVEARFNGNNKPANGEILATLQISVALRRKVAMIRK